MTVDGVEISRPLNRPFFESPIGGQSKPEGPASDIGFLPVAIDDREFIVDLTSNRYRRTLVEVLRSRQNTQPNESLLLSPEVWRTTVESWHQGAGQTRKDRDDSLPYRFFASKGVNVWNKWGITLLPKTITVTDDVVGDTQMIATPSGIYIVDTFGSRMRYVTDLGTMTTQTISLPANVIDMTTDGTSVYAALSDLSVKKITGATVTQFCDLPAGPTMIVHLKGLLVAACGPALYDISLGVNITDDTYLIDRHPLATHEWRDACDGLAAGYIIGGQGKRWKVYSITVRDDASTFNPPVVAAPLPEGEEAISIGSYLGYVLVGVDKGIRFCVANGDASLTYGRLIYTGSPVIGMEGEDRFVWFGIGGRQANNVQALMQSGGGLARLDLSTFTAPLTPAYASDIYAHDDPFAPAMTPVTFQDRRVFGVRGSGVYAQDTVPVDEGVLQEGVINQQSRDEKIGLYAQVSCEPLRGAIYTTLADDSLVLPTDDPQVRVEAFNAVTSGNVDLLGLRFDGLVVEHRLRMTALPAPNVDDGTERLDNTPRMTRFELRTWPVPGRAHEWTIPIIVTDSINYLNATSGRSPKEDLDHLLALIESGRTFTFRELNREHRCFAMNYEWFPTHESQLAGEFNGVFVLTVRSIK